MIATVISVLILFVGLVRRADAYAAFVKGAKEGLKTAVHIAPTLCAALMLTASLRGSGLMETLGEALSSVLGQLGIREELLPFLMMRPVSGAGALAELDSLMRLHGADSDLARMACAMMGSSETVLYVLPVYLGAAGVKKSGYVLPAALAAMSVGMAVSAWAVML